MKSIELLKKSFSFLGVAVVASVCTCVVFAQKLDVSYKDLTFYLDGQKIDLTIENKGKPFIANGVTYVPVSTVAEIFGKKVTWNDKNEIHFEPKEIAKENQNSNTNNTGANLDGKIDAGSGFYYSDLKCPDDNDDPDEIKVRAKITNDSGTNYRKANFEISAYDANGKLLGSSIEDEEHFANNTTRYFDEDIDHLFNRDNVKSVKIRFIGGH